MNKINKIGINQVSGLTRRSLRCSVPDENEITHSSTTNGPRTNQDAKSLSRDPSLRERVEAVQKIKKELSIENQAATFGLEWLLPLLPIVPYVAKKIIDSILRSAAKSQVDGYVAEAVIALEREKYFSDDLLTPDLRAPMRAAKKILKADFKRPQEVTRKVETAVIELIKSPEHASASSDEVLDNKQKVRGLLLALEALYLRSDTKVDYSKIDTFISFLEHPHNYPLIYDERASMVSMKRMIALNWKLPIRPYKIPDPSKRATGYRLEIYTGMKESLDRAVKIERGIIDRTEVEEGLYAPDPLYLRTYINRVPANLQDKAKEFRDALVDIFKAETDLPEVSGNHDIKIPTMINAVLELSPEISPVRYSQQARNLQAQKEEDEKRLVEFKKWAHKVISFSEEEARRCFESLGDEQKRVLGPLPSDKKPKHKFLSVLLPGLLDVDVYQTKVGLNEACQSLLDVLMLDTEELGKKLTQNNSEKGLLFFSYLNQLMDKQVAVGNDSQRPFREFINQDNRDRILQSCRRIVHDTMNFRATPRGYEFFTEPNLNSGSVPGQALALSHKLTRCFNDEEGYVDVHGLKDLVLKRAVRSLYGYDSDSSATTRTFLLSGPPGTGKSSLAGTIANQLAIPLVLLSPGMVTVVREGEVEVKYEGRSQTVSEFIHEVNRLAPCVLLMDEVDKILPPRTKENQNKIPTDAFLSPMEPGVTESRLSTKVVLIMTTNQPPTKEIDVSSINDEGYSGSIDEELCKYIDPAVMREGRSDKKIFVFHRLFTEEQGALFARRFLEPYVKSGKVEGQVDYAEAGKTVMNYTPATVEKVFDDYAKSTQGQVTQEGMLNELKKRPGMIIYHADPRVSNLIDGTINAFVNGFKVKKLGSPAPNAKRLAIRVRELNLTDEQFTEAIACIAPEVLTQENILEAFEKVREQSGN